MRRVAITATATIAGGALPDALDRLPAVVRQRAQRAERLSQLAVAAAGQALVAADRLGDPDASPRPAFGVALGTAFGCFLTNAAYQRRLVLDGVRTASPRLFAGTVSNAAAGEVGIAFRLGGPAVTVTAGTAAGLVAIGHAMDLVADGRAEVMVAGGVDAQGPDLARWLGDGGLPGVDPALREGAAVLVLEAAPPGPPHGWLAGYAAGFVPPGEPEAAVGLAERALADAGAAASAIGLTVLVGPAALVPAAERVLRPVLGGAIHRTGGDGAAAGGPMAVVATLADARATGLGLVLQLCASGHAVALVMAAGGES